MKSSSLGLGPMAPQWTTAQHVRRRHAELAVHLVQRPWCPSVRDRRPVRLATDDALDPQPLHQPPDRATRDVEAFAAQLPPDLAHAIDPIVIFKDPQDLGAQRIVTARPVGLSRRVGPLRQMAVVGGRGDRQHAADRLDPMHPPMRIDERHRHFDRRSSIRLGQGRSGSQSRFSRSKVFARIMMRRMMAVMATFFALPAFSSC